MTDTELMTLFRTRDERAIAEADVQYGQTLRRIAKELLNDDRDAEETVSDVFLAAWNGLSQEEPVSLLGYLAAVTRNLSMDRLDRRNAQRRGGGQRPAVLDELAECIAAPGSVEQEADARMLTAAIERFLDSLPDQPRRAFILRYSLALPEKDIAARLNMNTGAVKISLHRTRKKLKAFLEQEGWL